MAPNFLKRKFCVKLCPANALFTILFEIMKFNPEALLTVMGVKKFQIKAHIPDHPGVLSLEMDSDSVSSTFNYGAYCLRFPVHDWYERLKNCIFQNPTSSISIQKPSGSYCVQCLFGKHKQLIELGKAEFVKRVPENPHNLFSYVGVTMAGVMFRLFMEDFSYKHGNGDSFIQLRITPTTVCWITRRGNFPYSVQEWGMTVFPVGIHQFPVRWDRDLFEMLRSAAIGCDSVELTVFDDYVMERCYRFRFIYSGESYYLSYMEQVP